MNTGAYPPQWDDQNGYLKPQSAQLFNTRAATVHSFGISRLQFWALIIIIISSVLGTTVVFLPLSSGSDASESVMFSAGDEGMREFAIILIVLFLAFAVMSAIILLLHAGRAYIKQRTIQNIQFAFCMLFLVLGFVMLVLCFAMLSALFSTRGSALGVGTVLFVISSFTVTLCSIPGLFTPKNPKTQRGLQPPVSAP